LHQFYYLFGFLFLVFVILAITCAEITIVMCYFQLCSEVSHPPPHTTTIMVYFL
jgi:transmembrane 9 superfamily protein 2/4